MQIRLILVINKRNIIIFNWQYTVVDFMVHEYCDSCIN